MVYKYSHTFYQCCVNTVTPLEMVYQYSPTSRLCVHGGHLRVLLRRVRALGRAVRAVLRLLLRLRGLRRNRVSGWRDRWSVFTCVVV